MDALSRPPVPSSPRPSRMKEPSSRPRPTSASARELTTAARSLASWPSGRSGWVVYSVSVTTRPSTESPRNSSRSLVGRPPFSYAYERWVSARTRRADSSLYPSRPSNSVWDEAWLSPAFFFGVDTVPLTSRSDLEDLALVVGATSRARDVLQLGLVAALARNQGGDRSLPLRPAVARVAARHLPLRNSHGYFSCFSSTPGSAPLISSFSPSSSEPASPCSAAQRMSTASWWWSGSSASRAPHWEHRPGQSSWHTGCIGSASTTASRSTGSRSNRPSSMKSVSSSSSASSAGSALGRPRSSASGYENISWNSASSSSPSGSRHLTHSPLASARAVPVTSTPSMTDS